MKTFENIPGFTADASLYRGARHYRTSAVSPSAHRGVIPQLRRSTGFCMADCDANDPDPLSNYACKVGCLENGGGGEPGGGSEPECTPGCSTCRKMPGARRGTKTCISSNCEEREVRC